MALKTFAVVVLGILLKNNISYLNIYTEEIRLMIKIIRLESLLNAMKFYPKSILIWFNNEGNDDILNLKEVSAQKKVTVLHHFADGDIFLCETHSSIHK